MGEEGGGGGGEGRRFKDKGCLKREKGKICKKIILYSITEYLRCCF